MTNRHLFPIRIERTVRVGDILTSFSIVISALALALTVKNNFALERQQQANQIRTAAATTLAKIERLEELSLYGFDDLKPAILKAGDTYKSASDARAVRDALWTSIDEARLRAKARFFDEQIQAAYVNLYGFSPDVRQRFLDTISGFEQSEDNLYDHLSDVTQATIETAAQNDVADGFQQQLQNTLADEQTKYKAHLDTVLTPIETFLVNLVRSDDNTLLVDHVNQSKTK